MLVPKSNKSFTNFEEVCFCKYLLHFTCTLYCDLIDLRILSIKWSFVRAGNRDVLVEGSWANIVLDSSSHKSVSAVCTTAN